MLVLFVLSYHAAFLAIIAPCGLLKYQNKEDIRDRPSVTWIHLLISKYLKMSRRQKRPFWIFETEILGKDKSIYSEEWGGRKQASREP